MRHRYLSAHRIVQLAMFWDVIGIWFFSNSFAIRLKVREFTYFPLMIADTTDGDARLFLNRYAGWQ